MRVLVTEVFGNCWGCGSGRRGSGVGMGVTGRGFQFISYRAIEAQVSLSSDLDNLRKLMLSCCYRSDYYRFFLWRHILCAGG